MPKQTKKRPAKRAGRAPGTTDPAASKLLRENEKLRALLKGANAMIDKMAIEILTLRKQLAARPAERATAHLPEPHYSME